MLACCLEALDKDGKVKRIHKWTDLDDPQQLERATLEFTLELKNQIGELKKLRQILNIQQVPFDLDLSALIATSHHTGWPIEIPSRFVLLHHPS